MKASREEALLVLESWKNSAAVIALISQIDNLTLKLTCRVSEASTTQLGLEINPFNLITIDLQDCEFAFGDPREFPEVPEPSGGHTYEHFVQIQFKDVIIMLFEATEETRRKHGL